MDEDGPSSTASQSCWTVLAQSAQSPSHPELRDSSVADDSCVCNDLVTHPQVSAPEELPHVHSMGALSFKVLATTRPWRLHMAVHMSYWPVGTPSVEKAQKKEYGRSAASGWSTGAHHRSSPAGLIFSQLHSHVHNNVSQGKVGHCIYSV